MHDPRDFIWTKDTPCQISMHFGWWFMRRRFLKIYQNFPYFASFWASKGASPFIWTNLNPHPPRKKLMPDGQTTDAVPYGISSPGLSSKWADKFTSKLYFKRFIKVFLKSLHFNHYLCLIHKILSSKWYISKLTIWDLLRWSLYYFRTIILLKYNENRILLFVRQHLLMTYYMCINKRPNGP